MIPKSAVFALALAACALPSPCGRAQNGDSATLMACKSINKITTKTTAEQTPVYSRANEWREQLEEYYRKDESAFPKPGAILFAGGSTIRMWDNIGSYFPKHRIINRGFGGAWISDLLFHMRRLVIDYKPAQIVLYAGINDVNNGVSPQRVFEDIKCFVRLVEINLPGVPVIILSLRQSPATANKLNEQLLTNKLLNEYYKNHSVVTFVDVSSMMHDQNGKLRAELYLKDRLHVTAAAYRELARIIEPYLINNTFKNQPFLQSALQY
jgi:lysophospholipase L1-like esterase